MPETRGRVVPEARGRVVPEARGKVVPEARGRVVPEARGRVVPEARGKVVAEARRWIGTPYLHGAARRGAGCDCLGLVRGVWVALAGAAPEAVPAYPRHEASAREILRDAARRHLREIAPEAAGPGDLLLFRLRRGAAARHLGVMAAQGGGPSFIHAYEGHGVVESPLTPPWRRRIAACFALTERIG